MKSILLAGTCLLFSLVVSVSFAAGGKNQIQNPILGDNCIEAFPPGIDANACEEVPAPSQAGVNVFFCDTTTVVICTDEEPEEGETDE
jgi:hypothetical protein